MRPESQAQASDRGCGQPHGRVQAVRRLPHAADRHMIGVREPANGESRISWGESNSSIGRGLAALSDRCGVTARTGPRRQEDSRAAATDRPQRCIPEPARRRPGPRVPALVRGGECRFGWSRREQRPSFWALGGTNEPKARCRDVMRAGRRTRGRTVTRIGPRLGSASLGVWPNCGLRLRARRAVRTIRARSWRAPAWECRRWHQLLRTPASTCGSRAC